MPFLACPTLYVGRELFNLDGVIHANTMSFLVSNGVEAEPPSVNVMSGNAWQTPAGWNNIGYTEKVDGWSLDSGTNGSAPGRSNRIDDLENRYNNKSFIISSLQFDKQSILTLAQGSSEVNSLGAIELPASGSLFKSCLVRFHGPLGTYGYYFKRVKLLPSESLETAFNALSTIGFEGFIQPVNTGYEMLMYPPTKN